MYENAMIKHCYTNCQRINRNNYG